MEHQRTDPIREAVAAGEYQRATVLWNEYVTEVLEEINRGTCTQAVMEETAELLEWSRGVVLCDRARAQSQLTTLWVASQYGPTDSPRACCFRASL
jgi:hypothetical protein